MDNTTAILDIINKFPGCSKGRINRITGADQSITIQHLIDTYQIQATLSAKNKAKYYIIKNPERAAFNAKRKDVFHNDEHHKILRRTRSKMLRLLNRGRPVRDNKFAKVLGCSTKEFCQYLESQFEEGMTWENHGVGRGRWNIDHIKPCANFDLTDQKQFNECWHHTNMRPLWAEQNLSEGAVHRRKKTKTD